MVKKNKYKICVDLDSAREDADLLEEKIIYADNEDEALEKAEELIANTIINRLYYNVSEYDGDED
tara:strand:- start:61 stop:255 length:195 start_codon:yes stop_codon:yes gene_type:complete